MQVLSRDIDRPEADVLARGEFDFFEGDRLPGDVRIAISQRSSGDCLAGSPLAGDANIAFQHGLGVVVGLPPFDVGNFAGEVQFANKVGFAVVQVNGFGIHELGQR